MQWLATVSRVPGDCSGRVHDLVDRSGNRPFQRDGRGGGRARQAIEEHLHVQQLFVLVQYGVQMIQRLSQMRAGAVQQRKSPEEAVGGRAEAWLVLHDQVEVDVLQSLGAAAKCANEHSLTSMTERVDKDRSVHATWANTRNATIKPRTGP